MAQDNDRQASDADRESAMEELKDEVAEEVGVDPDRYGGNVPAKKWGALGGHMVKRLIEKGEQALAQEEDSAGNTLHSASDALDDEGPQG